MPLLKPLAQSLCAKATFKKSEETQFSVVHLSPPRKAPPKQVVAGHIGGGKTILTIDMGNTIRPDEIRVPNLHYGLPHPTFFVTNIRILIETNVYVHGLLKYLALEQHPSENFNSSVSGGWFVCF